MIAALLNRHRAELQGSVNSATVDDLITIVRAMINAALIHGTPPAAAEHRILRAVMGYLLLP
jgi:hypothetical protein